MVIGRLIDGLKAMLPSSPKNRRELADEIERINRTLAENIARLVDPELSSTCSQVRIAAARTGADVYLELMATLPPHVEGELAARTAFAEIVLLWQAYAGSELPYAAPVGQLLAQFLGAYRDTPIRELPNLIRTYADRMRAAEEVLSARR